MYFFLNFSSKTSLVSSSKPAQITANKSQFNNRLKAANLLRKTDSRLSQPLSSNKQANTKCECLASK
jgi:hypothetical protein